MTIFLTFASFLYFLTQTTEGCRILKFDSCIPNQNLTGHVLSRHDVNSDNLCGIKCYNEKRCVSYNLGPKSGVHRACVLSYSDHVIHPRSIQKGSTYEYCFFKNNPCSSKPCSSGSCRPDETFSTYAECVCFISDPCYKGCNLPLGMQSGAIPNASITASSVWGAGHEAYRARLHLQGHQFNPHVNAGSWASRHLRSGEYLQVDLGEIKWISMVATQGRSLLWEQWIKSYTLAYSQDGVNYKMYKDFLNDDVKVFQGNTDRDTVVKHVLQKRAIKAKVIRFYIKSWHGHISMRAEIYGCSL